ncbi:OmpA family protein [Paracidovorax anthurii]|uniref:OOP family OmpA-OmpF porin n=1 Tax=Paracidovorax anthurii TaxID=78229 RepID=A0A328ZDU8_9BURK|nr:OmpA family protein [Paracidovorax anthurii]RAR83583.1 OOP family OmpA-OmpF porin [Paracidovorax anthurii]
MKRRPSATSWRPSAVASCLAVTACAVTPPPPAPMPAPAAVEAIRMAQRGHGRDAAFERCGGDACPQRTPKTLPAPPGPAFPSPADSETVASPPGHPEERTEHVPPPAPAPASASPSPPSPAVQQVSVHFPFASARLDTAARAALREAMPRLARADEVTLSGRTDSTGPAAANDWLAQARAQAVLREILALAPGTAARVHVDAQGGCCFAESNDSPAGRARNRRVEIRYRIDHHDPP